MKKEDFAKLKPNEIILFPLISEKAVGMIETQNKIVFVVHKLADKQTVKKSVEQLYNVRVLNVQTLNDRKGRKTAIVRLSKEFKADDLATKLGVI